MHQRDIIFGEEVLIARADKTLFWPKENTLFMADLHFGKMAHFRKNGLAVPEIGVSAIIASIQKAIEETGTKRLVVLGDFFHSVENSMMAEIEKHWKFELEQWLVPGNHDIIDTVWFEKIGFEIKSQGTLLLPFTLLHEPTAPQSNQFYLCGHVHPAVVIKGKAKQSLRLPCFHVERQTLILPALGAFTGTASLKVSKKGEFQIAVSGGEVFLVE